MRANRYRSAGVGAGQVSRPLRIRPSLLGLLVIVTHSIVLSDLQADGRLVAAPPEEILTNDGRRYRGRVVGYDADRKGYILRTGEHELTIPEGKILTIRSIESLAPFPSGGEVSETAESSPEAIFTLEKGRRREGTQQLRALLEGLAALPRPDPGAAALFDEAVVFVRDGLFTRARRAFQQVRELAPHDLASGLFLGACHLAEREYRSAYLELHATAARHPEEPIVLDLLARAARDLGYHREAAEFAERSISLRFTGAERRYRVFALKLELNLDPALTREAWIEYLVVDPDLTTVDSLEAVFFRRGKEALSRGEYRLALDTLATATEINPFLHAPVRPYRIKALELRALAARERGDFELFFGDMSSLARTAPERADEFEYRRREGETAMVRSGLENAADSDALRRLIWHLEVWVSDLRSRHATAVRDRAESLVRKAIFRGQVDRAVDVMRFLAILDWPGLEVGGIRRELLEYLEEQVAMDLEEGRKDAVREWARGMKEVAPALASRWSKSLGDSGGLGNQRRIEVPESVPVPEARPRAETLTLSPSPLVDSPTTPDSLPPDSSSSPGPVAPTTAPPPTVSPQTASSSTGSSSKGADPSSTGSESTGTNSTRPSPTPPPPAGEPPTVVVVSPATEEKAGADARVSGVATPVPPPPGENASPQYFPLVHGSKWVYRHADGTLDHQHLDRVEENPADKGTVHRFSNRFVIGDLNIAYAKSCFSDGEYLYLGPSTDRSSADRFLRLPVALGKRWSWRSGSIVYEKTYEAMDVTVVCRAGVFTDCLKVKSVSRYDSESSHTVAQWLYFAKGVGLVKVVSENPADGIELVSYEIPTASPPSGTEAAPPSSTAAEPETIGPPVLDSPKSEESDSAKAARGDEPRRHGDTEAQ